jgi:NAD(P)-dependent dehydrogenase (short-subunit alcohol dehydrogenase family)
VMNQSTLIYKVNVQATAVYLACDDQSSYVTGAVMNLTGGNPHIG